MIKTFLSALFCFLFVVIFFAKTSSAYYFDPIAGTGSFSDLTFAIHTYDASNTSNEAPQINGRMVVHIEARQGLDKNSIPANRFTASQYSINISPGDKPDEVCQLSNTGLSGPTSYFSAAPESANVLKFTVPLENLSRSCGINAGKIHVTLWTGGDDQNTPNNRLFNPTPIFVDQPGGGSASIAPLNDLTKNYICPGKPAAVNLLGSSSNQTYSFWWDGTKGIASNEPGTGQPSSIKYIETVPGNGNPGTYTLCMQPDGWGLALFNTCQKKYSVPFMIPADPTKVCSPENLPKTCELKTGTIDNKAGSKLYTLTPVGANYLPGKYRLDILDKTTGQNVVTSHPFEVDSTGVMNVNNLGQIFTPSKYGLYIYPNTGDQATDSVSTCRNDDAATVTDQPGGAVATPLPSCNPNALGPDGKPNPDFCASAAGQVCAGNGVMTAIGCVPTEPQKFVAGLMKYVLGFGGGVALLLMVFGSFQMVTSSGNPDSIKKGSEQFTNAVIGLLFIIFSTLFMQILGVDILNLPGFTK